ncbi:MAG: hypothetical protein IJ656_00345 [Bacilli bacterium]|nr:hypothetical protein [Bacilli bacterium]
MKKCNKALSVLACITAAASLVSCNETVTSKNGTLLSYVDQSGVAVDFTTDDLLLNYFENDSSATSDLYGYAYDAFVKKYFSKEENKALLDDIKNEADIRIKQQENKAQENADSNKTQYKDEWNKILDSELSSYREGKRTTERLREKYELEEMKSEITDQFYEKFKDWKDISGDELQEKYNIFSGENGYLEKRLPYHVRHILVKVDAGSNTIYNGQISESDAEDLYNVVEALATGASFGTVAEDHSEDSATSYGNLGIMDKATSFVNEFKLGVYTYDTLFNNNAEVKASLATDEDPFNMLDTKAQFEALGVANIPFAAVQELYNLKSLTKNAENKEVNDGNMNYYPRNIIFNKYFNNHNFGFITLTDTKFDDAATLKTKGQTGTVGNTYYTDLDADGKWAVGSAYTGDTTGLSIDQAHKSGFKDITLKDGTVMSKVLCDENGNPILVVRAGTSDYQGVHFITIERSALEKTATYAYLDTDGNEVGTYTSTLNEYYAAESPVTLSGRLNSNFPHVEFSGKTVNKKSYINNVVSDYNSYTSRADTLKSTIKSFDPSYNYRVYLWLMETVNDSGEEATVTVTVSGGKETNVTEIINKYVYKEIAKNEKNFKIDNKTWKDYLTYLENQKQERKTKLIPETCALGFASGTGYEDGGICKYVSKA